MNLDRILKDLQRVNLDKPHSVFSMYLNTDSTDPGHRGEWKLQLKNGLNSFENYLEQSGNLVEYKHFQHVREKVENYVEANQLFFKKSVVLIASSDDTVWFAETFQMNVDSEFFWQENAVTDQLYQLKSRFPRTGIILLQHAKTRVIDAEVGEVNDTVELAVDGETEKWIPTNQMEDTSFRLANTQVKLNPNRTFKSLAPMVDRLAKDKGWEEIVIAGNKEEAELLEHYMNKSVNKIMNQNILDKKPQKIVEEII
ncbi:VLRF1 family aeRF1-type release factor [Aquibacillus salsiterrae]|uniref:VLRF1 family aeRF1-type release factor n=1 Tax=Aquibacillus salsiterrae TaxID=2950439 RepID=A0A9X3WF76_9BACI|nr:VLRF1 family aeRF1-type release factor [Aquibacillus salsiterrae]MDC3417898.1 VLRF1 family aeRF1-type release factor [Aquibacillus salsiterrae]